MREAKKSVFFVTNNTTKTRDQYVEKFVKMGIEAKKEEIFGAGYLAAYYLGVKSKPKGKLYLCGNNAIAKELEEVKVDFFGLGPDESLNTTDVEIWVNAVLEENVSDVLVAFDPNFNYTKMLRAASYINNGANFIVTNEDAVCPISRKELTVPGVGAIVAGIKKSVSSEPDMVCGKPSILAFQLIQDRFGSHITPETTVMFGDRIDTDIVFGKNVGCATVLTMTGVTDDEILERSEIKPDYVIQNFTELA